MLSEELRRKIEDLNRQPLPGRRHAEGASLLYSAEALGTLEPAAVVPRPHFLSGDGPLSVLVPGSEHQNASGVHYRVRMPLQEFWSHSLQALQVAAEFRNKPAACDPDVAVLHPELAGFLQHFPTATLFLDLETCGFAGSMVFLVGLVWHDGQEWVLDQLLARNYAEERALLETLWQIVALQSLLVTFNGKSFDWPMVLDRSTLHRFEQPTGSGGRLPHCDLLHHARRKWKGLLPNCKLQTLEQAVCRRRRQDDLGGAEIPLAYHQFVRTGDARQMQSILRHNALDLVTLVEVAVKVATAPSR